MLLAPLMPSEPVWLNQVHGVSVADAGHAGCLRKPMPACRLIPVRCAW